VTLSDSFFFITMRNQSTNAAFRGAGRSIAETPQAIGESGVKGFTDCRKN
jgi:hypothetical protein